MSNRTDTLMAYEITFTPLVKKSSKKQTILENDAEYIKTDPALNYKLDSFFVDFLKGIKDKNVTKDSQKIVLCESIKKDQENENSQRFYIKTNCGRRNVVTKMVNTKNSETTEHIYNEEWSPTIGYNIFAYQIKEKYYAVFHRENNSGCKTAFLEAVNQIIKSKGVRMNLNLLLPNANSHYDYNKPVIPKKIKLFYKKKNTSDDIADHISKKNKHRQTIVKELTLYLKEHENIFAKNIFEKLWNKLITWGQALKEIQNELSDEYNSASFFVQIGKKRRWISWEQFEDTIGVYDITKEFDELKKKTNNPIEALGICADNYLSNLLKD
ncbi:hypothetical protein [Mycoplasmopsis agassizii]|uniref:Uncharacterized protein n=1 Tax=Mycoplasmopsis agassizii TaxID=33922 RepID=A0ABX4H437_9BACT|nr:hypothetical protein [Mycoplasmopsis agassizii]PAF54648.1 hypothetical protein CJF60_02820 [Mycoplasmopsis agassizii]SMC16182.1 hypothetical protein SAMN02745179_00237 [Mycoplasmopsis agassizii]